MDTQRIAKTGGQMATRTLSYADERKNRFVKRRPLRHMRTIRQGKKGIDKEAIDYCFSNKILEKQYK